MVDNNGIWQEVATRGSQSDTKDEAYESAAQSAEKTNFHDIDENCMHFLFLQGLSTINSCSINPTELETMIPPPPYILPSSVFGTKYIAMQ